MSIAQKRDYIGSAHIAGILGIEGAYGSELSIAHELKTGESIFDDEENLPEPINLGIELEPYVLKLYAKTESARIRAEQPHYRLPGWPMIGATPDAIAVSASGESRLVDAKVVGDYKWSEIPLRYEASSQWQLGIARAAGEDVTECDLAVYHLPARRLVSYRVTFHEEWFNGASDYAIDWYRRYVVGDELPPITGHRATTDILKKIQASIGKTVSLDDHAELIDQLATATEDLKAAEEIRDTFRNQLMALMGDSEIGLVDGKPRFTWKAQKGRTSLDQKALKADHPQIFAEYVKQNPSFRVPRIVKGK